MNRFKFYYFVLSYSIDYVSKWLWMTFVLCGILFVTILAPVFEFRIEFNELINLCSSAINFLNGNPKFSWKYWLYTKIKYFIILDIYPLFGVFSIVVSVNISYFIKPSACYHWNVSISLLKKVSAKENFNILA